MLRHYFSLCVVNQPGNVINKKTKKERKEEERHTGTQREIEKKKIIL
jgi:hypothetical protein